MVVSKVNTVPLFHCSTAEQLPTSTSLNDKGILLCTPLVILYPICCTALCGNTVWEAEHRAAHGGGGEEATARAAKTTNTLMTVSLSATTSLEDIAAAGESSMGSVSSMGRWLQLSLSSLKARTVQRTVHLTVHLQHFTCAHAHRASCVL